MYFSSTTGQFYDPAVNAEMPQDVVEISADEHRSLLQGEAVGKSISRAAKGYPVLIDQPVVVVTPELAEASLTAVLNRHLDSVAGQRRYDSRFTCALRAGFPGPFQEEGRVFAAWMDACNMAGYQLMAEVKAGSRTIPTDAELIAALPVIEWPASPIPEGAA